MFSDMNSEVSRITNGPKHHFFGFHDIVQTNAKGDLALSLEVDDISHPPLPGETCGCGVVTLADGIFREIHRTHAWNYPQGARQQWVGGTDICLCNDREEDGRLICRVSDAREKKVVDTLPFPVHCVNAKTRQTFSMNYGRVHASGGYGYTPNATMRCVGRIVDMPEDEGITVGNLNTKTKELLVSIAQVAACGEVKPVVTGYPHYLTHLMLNPSGTRLCFLHRYRVSDGGEITRLMTIGTDGLKLRCLAKGFLSHFTWISDDEIFIWGKDERTLCKMRESFWLRVPGVLSFAVMAKKCVRSARRIRTRKVQIGTDRIAQDKAFLIIQDRDTPVMVKNGVGILAEDGHPMACPANHRHLVSDTYPNEDGDRWLMFYDVNCQERMNVGRFRRLFVEPDPNAFDWRAAQKGIDSRILKKFPCGLYLFTRSGYHADLHPRWSYDGKLAFFDSIHEGSRQIYAVRAQ